jgi:hypothetical protein
LGEGEGDGEEEEGKGEMHRHSLLWGRLEQIVESWVQKLHVFTDIRYLAIYLLRNTTVFCPLLTLEFFPECFILLAGVACARGTRID